jgi:hypothetical protein
MLFTSASAEAGVAFMSAKAAPMSPRRRRPRMPRRTDLVMPELFEIKKLSTFYTSQTPSPPSIL